MKEKQVKEKKTLKYDWEFGHEELILRVGAYGMGNGLAIVLYHMVGECEQEFDDLTVNLPFEPTEVNEAFIKDFCSKDKLKFIRKHRLGRILPEKGHSGYCTYAKVAFDLDRLAEFDPAGVERYRRMHEL